MNYSPSRSYADQEEVVQVNLANIIDPTLLRSLGLIKNEEDVDAYFIDGRSVVPLMIKFKKKKQEVEVIYHDRVKTT